jgi:hypothetical protein
MLLGTEGIFTTTHVEKKTIDHLHAHREMQ